MSTKTSSDIKRLVESASKNRTKNSRASELAQKTMTEMGIKPRVRIRTLDDLKRFAETQGVDVPEEKKESLFRRGLDLISRPLYASAGAAKAIGTGENVLQETWKGLTGEEKETYADVIAAEGIDNKFIQGGLGFVLDIVMDPTTYLGGPAIKGAAKVSSGATKLGMKGVRKFDPRIASALEATGESVKDAFGYAFKEGYKTSAKLNKGGIAVKALTDDVAKHFNKLGVGVEDITKGFADDYKNLPKAQHEEFATTLLDARRRLTDIQKGVENEAFKEWGKLFPDVKVRSREKAANLLKNIEGNTVKQISSIRSRVDGIIKKEYDRSGQFIVSGEGGRLKKIDQLNEIVEGLKDELNNVQKFKKSVPEPRPGFSPEEMNAVHSRLITYEEERLSDVILSLTNKLNRAGKEGAKEVAEGAAKVVDKATSVDDILIESERSIKKITK